MKYTVSSLAVILNVLLIMHRAAARSLPRKQETTEENWTLTQKEVNFDSLELTNLSIPSYLKDLYINLTYPNGVAHPSLNHHKDIKINTIQSYKNKAKSKLKLIMQIT